MATTSKLYLTIACFLCALLGYSQITPISNYSGTFNNSSNPSKFTEYNGWLYFSAKSDGTYYELWRTNGTGITELFADIGILDYGGQPDYFVVFQSELYFIANNSIDGIQIWKTDGTVQGTVAITKFNYPTDSFFCSSCTGSLQIFDNQLFFVHNSVEFGTEIWKTDGTWSGTTLLKDINVGSNGSMSSTSPNFVIMGSNLYFFANDGIHGKELWKTDGTETGTTLVKDIYVGSTQCYGSSLIFCNNMLYFRADDGIHGGEIWKSDGTEIGTLLTSDIYAGSIGSDPNYLTASNDKVFFSAITNAANRELWVTDGTVAGTYLVKDIAPGTPSGDPLNLYGGGNALYFAANNNSNGIELWKSDGTNTGTVMVKDIRSAGSSDPKNFHYYNGYVYFQANDGVTGQELWRTDGTTIGTTIVANINGGGSGSLPGNFTDYAGKMVFQATKNSTINYEPWITDGTSGGTINLRNIYIADNLDDVAYDGGVFKNKLYFDAVSSSNSRLFTTAGTAASTSLFSSIVGPKNYYTVGNRMFFHGDAGVYRTNGTAAGTALVASIGYPAEPTYVDATLNGKYAYFTTNFSATVINLYLCDSNSPPVLVKSISNASMNSSFECITMNNVLYFSMTTVSAGRELWRSDGTNSGTYLLKNIAAGSTSSNPKYLTVVGNKLYFSADNGINGIELWQSDGTAAGTILLKDIIVGSTSSNPENLAVFDDTLYFSAENGTNGIELWKSDGTETGTSLYMDIVVGSFSSKPMNLVTGFNGLYFSAFTENEGRELWVKKTGVLPEIVADIGPGKFSGNPSNLKVIDNLMYFTANDEIHGYEPYVTLGSECSTSMISDANPGDKGCSPYFFGNVNGKIVMRADTDMDNSEVYSFTAPSQHTDTIYACQKYYWATIDDTLENSGLYTTIITSSIGCDSIINLQLTIGQPSNTVQTVTACSSYTWIDGITYTSSNSTATYVLTSITGCDSLIQLNLMINSPTNSFDTVTACNSYLWSANNSILTVSGDYSTALTAVNGCDSIVFLNLTVNEPSESVISISTCDSYTWVNGITYTTSTSNPIWHYTNINGCDSIVHLNLTILNTSAIEYQTACDSYTWIDGHTYTASTNNPTWILTNSNGCDSLITLNLTILNNLGTDVRTACQSYTWIDGITYNSSTNNPTWILTNSNGCDSLVTLNLTILETNAIDIQMACQSYTWIDGNTYTYSTNSPTHVLTNSQGCDSIVTLNLTITNPSSGIDIQTACDSYTWMDGITYTSSTNSPTYVLTNSQGCDSIITLNLTVTNPSSGIDIQTACDFYTWINGVTYTTTTNSPTFTLTNVNGCDSIITLNLTITNHTNAIDVQTACGPYTWIDGATYTASTDTPSWIIPNSNGCDSIITLNLTINPIPNATATDNNNATITAGGIGNYQWINCSNNSEINGATSETFAPTANGTYAVVVDNGNCSDTSNCVTISNIGLEDADGLKLSIAPNPTTDMVTILFEGNNAELIVYDTQGKLIQTSNIISGTQVSLKNVETGVYFFEITTNEGKAVKRVVKN